MGLFFVGYPIYIAFLWAVDQALGALAALAFLLGFAAWFALEIWSDGFDSELVTCDKEVLRKSCVVYHQHVWCLF